MFQEIIDQLEKKGHSVLITSRPLANTVDLLNRAGMKHTIIGKHYGKNILLKIMGYPIRIFELWKFLKQKNIDLAISQSSFHSPITAYLLRIPSIYTNDNEHAMGNIPSFYFATKIMIPENFKFDNISNYNKIINKTIKYPGIKEGIYLWKKADAINGNDNENKNNKIKIYIRPEPQTAQYYNGDKNFLDEFIIELKDDYNINILPRNKNQESHYSNILFKNIKVIKTPLSFEEIAKDCSIFVGAGGSMTREMAMIGIPTISVYQEELLAVDKLLLEKNMMIHDPKLNATKMKHYINTFKNKPANMELMDMGKNAFDLFLAEIETFNVTNK
jgi:predicted glycosyltransferase